MKTFNQASYLALKEVWRYRGRFLLFSLVIALITLLVLFIAALGEGLGSRNREYISKLDAELVAFRDKSDFIASASRLDQSTLRAIRREEGVAAAGPISSSNTTIMLPDGEELKVAMLGVEANMPGQPEIVEGTTFRSAQANEVIVDQHVLDGSNIALGDTITIRSTQGTKDKLYALKVVGTTSGQYSTFQPSIFVPTQTWEQIRPKAEAELNNTKPVINVIAVKLADPENTKGMLAQLESNISNIQVADIPDTISSVPGYSAQQSTVQTQGFFTLLIGVLVIGGFFQIQILQKVPQIGVLKAIGASNMTVGMAAVIQIMVVTAMGVFIGGFLTFFFSLFFPPAVPLVFNGSASAFAILALLLIGPIGGMVSVIYAVRIEPLKALRLG